MRHGGASAQCGCAHSAVFRIPQQWAERLAEKSRPARPAGKVHLFSPAAAKSQRPRDEALPDCNRELAQNRQIPATAAAVAHGTPIASVSRSSAAFSWVSAVECRRALAPGLPVIDTISLPAESVRAKTTASAGSAGQTAAPHRFSSSVRVGNRATAGQTRRTLALLCLAGMTWGYVLTLYPGSADRFADTTGMASRVAGTTAGVSAGESVPWRRTRDGWEPAWWLTRPKTFYFPPLHPLWLFSAQVLCCVTAAMLERGPTTTTPPLPNANHQR